MPELHFKPKAPKEVERLIVKKQTPKARQASIKNIIGWEKRQAQDYLMLGFMLGAMGVFIIACVVIAL